MNSNDQQNTTFDLHVKLNQEFLKSWNDGTLDVTDPVYGLVRTQAYSLASSFGRLSEVQDFIQTGLILLARGQYKGNCPLGAYINTILRNELIRIWRRTGENKDEEFTDQIPDSETIFDKVIRRISSEKFMRQLMMSRPELQREIVRVFVEYDGEKRLSRAEIIRRLEDKGYERYPIIVAYQQLQQFLCQFRQ